MNIKPNGFIRKKLVVIIAAAVVLAAAGIAALLGGCGDTGSKGVDEPAYTDTHKDNAVTPAGKLSFLNTNVTISPSSYDSIGVSPESLFKLTFSEPADEKTLAASLRVEPEQAFRLNKVSDEEYLLEFEEPLQSDSIYNVVLNDNDTGEKASWAFQTKKSFNVIRTLPRHQSVEVPLNSGIEITFSHENVENAEKNFEISPAVNGRFEWHKKTLVFVPEKLEESTIYTVTIKKDTGVKGSEETLKDDYTFSFQTKVPGSGTRRAYFNFTDPVYNFNPQATPALQVYIQENLIDTDITAEIYSYPDADSFLRELKEFSPSSSVFWYQDTDKKPYDETKMKKAASITGRIAQIRNRYWYSTYLVLPPSSLPEGYYLLAVSVDGKKYYTQLQVNTTSAYIMKTKEKTLAWLNDSVTGKPLSGAEFISDGGISVKSDQNGMAVLPEPDTGGNVSYFLIKPASGLTYVARVAKNIYDYFGPNTSDDYWTYLYIDKDMFLPNDTINVWGILKPRDSSSAETTAVLELTRYNYYSYMDNNISVLTSQNIKISPDGTFTGNLKTTGYNPGSYEVRVRIGEKVMLTRYLQVMEYTKPVYKLEVTKDRDYMYAWETVNFDIAASFYEGTPVSGVSLNYSYWISEGGSKNGVLTSDASGASKLAIQPATSAKGWRPFSLSLDIENREAEEQPIYEHSSVTVFPKDTMIEMESKTKDQTATINFSTNKIDLAKLKDNASGYYSADLYKGAAVDIPLTVKLFERHYEKKKTGDYYDYINKVRQDTYEYYEVSNLINEYGFVTENGKYELQFAAEKGKNYYAEVYASDSQGRPIQENFYIYGWEYYDLYDNRTYILADTDVNRARVLDEPISVEVRYNKEQPFTGENRKYLFVRMKNGILDYQVTADPLYRFTFGRDSVPNMYVKAVCFDGTDMYDAGMGRYWYDCSEKELSVSVKPDKESYKPGETVKLDFEVKDKQGQPCSAELNISIVDEAFFTMAPQYVDLLNTLYGWNVSSGMLADYFSYTSPMDMAGSPMAEMGEGGDAYVRKDFKDSALFVTVSSGSDGKASAQFTMPDNLTSWRITWQAVTPELQSASGKRNITSKLPFFVDAIFNKVFITGDSPSVILRAYGAELADGAAVNYKVTVTEQQSGESRSFTADGKANTASEIPLGSFDAGAYAIRVEGVSGDLSDAMERTFNVSDSLLETSKTEYISLSDDTVIKNAAKGLTSLVFYGEDSALLYRELQSLYWSWGQRLDQKLARRLSGKLLKNYFNEDRYIDEEFDIKKYQTQDGGLALLTYDSSNPELSAKMCSLAAEDIDAEALSAYFRGILENADTTQEDIAYCYWGLAALKEPVLLDIRSILASGAAPQEIRLILGVALSEIGDYNGAREIYNEMMEKSGKNTQLYAWAETGTRDDSIHATSLCSLIALRINAPEKVKLFNYMKSNSTSELLVNLERMVFVTNYIKEASLDNSFSYELDGAKKQIKLQKGGFFRLWVTPEKLASIKFSSMQGKVTAAASYIAPVSEIRPAEGNIVSLKRVYGSSKDAATVSFNRSDLVKITITPVFSETAPDGYYEITDILPAGLRYIRPEYNSGHVNDRWYPGEVTGQRVVFGYYYNKKSSIGRSIIYYAAAVNPGVYTADNAAIRHTDNDISGFTGKLGITVSK